MSTDTDGVPPSVAPGSDDDAGAAETAEPGGTWLQAEIQRRMAAARNGSGGRHARHGGPEPTPARPEYRARHASAPPPPRAAPVDEAASGADAAVTPAGPARSADPADAVWRAGADPAAARPTGATSERAPAAWSAGGAAWSAGTEPATAAFSAGAEMWTRPPPTAPEAPTDAGPSTADVVPLPARPAPTPARPDTPSTVDSGPSPDDPAGAGLGTVIPLRPPTPDPVAEAAAPDTALPTPADDAKSEPTTALPVQEEPAGEPAAPPAVEETVPKPVPSTWSGLGRAGAPRSGATGLGGPSLPDNLPLRRPRKQATPPGAAEVPPGPAAVDPHPRPPESGATGAHTVAPSPSAGAPDAVATNPAGTDPRAAAAPFAPDAGAPNSATAAPGAPASRPAPGAPDRGRPMPPAADPAAAMPRAGAPAAADPAGASTPPAADFRAADPGPAPPATPSFVTAPAATPPPHGRPADATAYDTGTNLWRPPRPGDPQTGRPYPPSGDAVARLLAAPPAPPPTEAIPTVPGMPARTPAAAPPPDEGDSYPPRPRNGGGYHYAGTYGPNRGYLPADYDDDDDEADDARVPDYGDTQADDDYDDYDDDRADGSGDGAEDGVIWRAAAPPAPPAPTASPAAPAGPLVGPPAPVTPPPPAPVSADPPPAPGKRVRVVLAERKAAARPVRTVVDLQGDSPVGEALRTGLIVDQMRVALRFALLGGLTLGVLPLLFYVVPELGTISILGLRLPWLVLGILVYPFLLGLGWWFTRTAERVEQDFADHIQDS